jgi:sigma-B regulation protein RsbU (phosphoserine phosphatase)
MRFREHDFEMRPGDRLFVYTDGVAEAMNTDRELFGTERLLTVLNSDPDASPQQVLENVTDGINGFVGEAEQFDDITMLGFAYYGSDDNTDIT